MVVATGLVATPMLFLSKGQTVMGGGAILIFWGLAYGGLSVGLMTWMMKAAPRAVEIAAALYVGIFNTGIATGAWAGGKLVDTLTLTAPLWLASGLAIAALLLTVMAGFTSTRTG